jgi:hypothetical protein
MALEQKKKVAYLFGAGATHAELFALNPYLQRATDGLLIRDVSSRVIERARQDVNYLRGLEPVSNASSGSLNIELLISLIENAKINDWANKTAYLKRLVREDIQAVLTPYRRGRFYLHRALLQLHTRKFALAKEEVVGFISLNYDDVLDKAYKEFYGNPDYCFTLEDGAGGTNVPLLKLHGSFNWNNAKIRGRHKPIEIIPLGSAKTYLHAPYAFIWNRALEVLIECDALRVIGCSLSPNDVHLIDLLFKAHLERQHAFDIEIIDADGVGENIRDSYGFFPGIRSLTNIEGLYFPDTNPPNPFKEWLRYKSRNMLGETRVKRHNYLRKVAE